jgi:HEAT repeat protein
MHKPELLAQAETIGTTDDLDKLVEFVDLLPTQQDPDVIAALIEAASTWVCLFKAFEDKVAEQIVCALRTWAASAKSPQLAEQARESAQLWQEMRIQWLDLTEFTAWPLELRRLAPDTLIENDGNTLLAFAKFLGNEEDEGVRATIAKALRRAQKPRKGSRARKQLEKALVDTAEEHALSVVESWNRKPKWRGIPKPESDLPLEERVEEWVWQADERYGIPSDLTAQQRGMFVRMAAEICGLSTPADWEEAAAYLTDENFHGLAAAFRWKADRLT